MVKLSKNMLFRVWEIPFRYNQTFWWVKNVLRDVEIGKKLRRNICNFENVYKTASDIAKKWFLICLGQAHHSEKSENSKSVKNVSKNIRNPSSAP